MRRAGSAMRAPPLRSLERRPSPGVATNSPNPPKRSPDEPSPIVGRQNRTQKSSPGKLLRQTKGYPSSGAPLGPRPGGGAPTRALPSPWGEARSWRRTAPSPIPMPGGGSVGGSQPEGLKARLARFALPFRCACSRAHGLHDLRGQLGGCLPAIKHYGPDRPHLILEHGSPIDDRLPKSRRAVSRRREPLDLRRGIDGKQENVIEEIQHVPQVDRDAADEQARSQFDGQLQTVAVPHPATSVRAVLPTSDLVVRVDGVVLEASEVGGHRGFPRAWVAGDQHRAAARGHESIVGGRGTLSRRQ